MAKTERQFNVYARSTTRKAVRDDRETPDWLYEQICSRLGVRPVLDVCANSQNSKCEYYLDKSIDALEVDWIDYVGVEHGVSPGELPVVWMNPPYSQPAVWCLKALEEASRGLIVVGLLPDDRSTRWYREYVDGVASFCLVTSARIAFPNPDTGKEQAGNPKGSVVPVWCPWMSGTLYRYLYVKKDPGDSK